MDIFKKKINKKLIVGCFLILIFQISMAASHTKSFMDNNSFSNEKNASTTFLSGSNSGLEAILEKDPNRFPGAQIISSEMNLSNARVVVRSENEENESRLHLMSTGEKAYEMVNFDKSQNWLDMMNMPNYGEGVKVALIGSGVYPHDDIKEKPDDTLRTMWYIDINWYSYWDPWPFYKITVYEATNTYINTELEWTTYSDYSHDTNKKVGVYDGADHGTPVTGALLKLAPYVDLIWVDFFDYGDSLNFFASAWGLELLNAWHDPDIISASWGSSSHYSGWDDPIDDLLADGTTVFTAASGSPGSSSVDYPARLSNIMAVGAVNTRDTPDEGERPFWSNYGPNLDVTAPGHSVRAQSEDGGYAEYNGTSFSAPIVAGEAAQMYQLLKTIRGSKPSSSTVENFLKHHCDPGGQDTDSSDYDATYSRQNNYYGHGITDAWEAISYATEDDYEDSNTNGWSVHYLTEASSPKFDVVTYNGPSPYPSGTKRGRMYMQDTSGDKQVIYKWGGAGNQPIKVDSDYDRHYSYYTERSNAYTYAYHDFYPILQDSNNYIKVRLYYKYLQVYRMYQGTLTKLYEENVKDHTGPWCYDWQQVEIAILTYGTYYLGMYVSRKADGSQYTSSLITLGGPFSYGVTYMNGPIALGFRGGWSSGNYGYAYWDCIKVSQIPTGGLLG